MADQITKDLGGITAYAAAVAAGYTGTKSQFETLMASYATVAQNAAASATAANGSAEDAEAFADGQRDGVDVGSDDPAYHNNAKYYAEQAEDFADSIDPDKIESHIDAAYIKETASGSIATFSDGAPAPVRSLVADIVPVQSGSGDPSPSNVRAISGWTECNVSVSAHNLFADEYNHLYKLPEPLLANTFVCASGKGNSNSRIYYCGADGVPHDYWSLSSIDPNDNQRQYRTFQLGVDTYYVYFSTQEVTDMQFEVVDNASATPSPYEECPTHTISFASAGTVYGGRLDVTSGVLTVDKEIVNLETLLFSTDGSYKYGLFTNAKAPVDNYTEANILAEKYKTVARYSMTEDNTVSITNAGYIYVRTPNAPSGNLVYELATPQTYQLTPTEVKTLLKNNNLWANTGDVTVEYVADTKTFIENLVNA